MASAILKSRNGNGPPSTDFVTNFTNNSNLTFTRLPNIPNPNTNPNPNPNPNPNHNPSHFIKSRNVVWNPSLPPPPANSYGYRYITYRLSSYTKREAKELRKRLLSDLERVRILRQCICTTPPLPKHKYHPPVEEVAVAGQKRMKAFPSTVVRDTKKHCGRLKNNNVKKSKLVMRKCGQILRKLMQHKHGWVFNTPVNVESLNLYDYHKIIPNPMDLGTIKSKLAKNEYQSPLSFASDVRLTFQNAMLYNGKGSKVYAMADRLLLLFENSFNSTQLKFVGNQVKNQNDVMKKKPTMTADQRSEMASWFSNLKLSQQGSDQLMAILKKGVSGLQFQEVDEIELDLAVLDNDTLWELRKFIDNRTRDMNSEHNSPVSEAVLDEECRISDGVGGEEDIDIGEEMQITNFPSIEIEKDVVNVSRSNNSSTSRSDSSSSDADSTSGGSSSGNSYNQQHVSNPARKGGSMGDGLDDVYFV